MSKYKQLGKDIGIYGIGIAVSKMINFLLVPLFTRVFSLAEYGTLNVYTTIGSFISVIFSFQIAVAMLRFYFDSKELKFRETIVSSGFIFLIGIALLLTSLSFIIPENLIVRFMGEIADKTIFRFMIVNNALLIIYFYLQMLLRVQRRPKLFAVFTASQIIISTIFIIIYVLILNIGIKGVFLGNISGLTIMITILLFRNRKLISFKYDNALMRKLFSYGLVLTIATLGVSINTDVSKIILLKFKSVEDVGLLSLAIKISGFVSLIITAFQQAWTPFAFSIMKDEDAKEHYAKVLEYFSLLFVVVSIITTYVFEITKLIAPPSYINAAKIVPIQLLATVVLSLFSIVNIGIHIKKKPVFATIAVYAGVLVNLSLLVVLLKFTDFGIYAVPVSYLMGNATQVLLVYYFSQRLYRIEFNKKIILMNIFSVVIFVALMYKCDGLLLRSISLLFYLILIVTLNKKNINLLVVFLDTKIKKIRFNKSLQREKK